MHISIKMYNAEQVSKMIQEVVKVREKLEFFSKYPQYSQIETDIQTHLVTYQKQRNYIENKKNIHRKTIDKQMCEATKGLEFCQYNASNRGVENA